MAKSHLSTLQGGFVTFWKIRNVCAFLPSPRVTSWQTHSRPTLSPTWAKGDNLYLESDLIEG